MLRSIRLRSRTINYMMELLIDRAFDGYMTEITTIYAQFGNFLNVKIEPAPDEWDRLFNVDFSPKIDKGIKR